MNGDADGIVELYFLRHAHAGNPDDWTGDDADRPLSSKGRRQAERLGRLLARNGFRADAILTSPKVRARQTAELVAAAVGTRVETDHRLAGSLDEDVVTRMVRETGGERVMLVGHDPDFSDLAGSLAGLEYLPLKKGTLVRLDATLPLQPGAAVLRWLVPPELIVED